MSEIEMPALGTETTLVMLMAAHRESRGAGGSGWIEAPEYAFGDLRTLMASGFVERHPEQSLWRPTIKAMQAARAAIIDPKPGPTTLDQVGTQGIKRAFDRSYQP